jgi:predicted metal-dependent hydrolase
VDPTPQRCAVTHRGTRIEYTLVRSARRRRTIGIVLSDNGEVVVRAPLRTPRRTVEDIVRRKAGWIERQRRDISRRGGATEAPTLTPTQLSKARAAAEPVLQAAVDRWARTMNCTPKRLLVRNQKRIWGSCARDGTLRLNWRLALLPQALIDYVVVHELTHLRVRNHQREFWSAVEAVLPDYRERRAQLRAVRLP